MERQKADLPRQTKGMSPHVRHERLVSVTPDYPLLSVTNMTKSESKPITKDLRGWKKNSRSSP